MVDFNRRTARATITIQGRDVSVPQPYTEGHSLTANEAAALNGLLSENLRNNLAKTFKELAEDANAQEVADQYAASYEFGVRGTRQRTTDPVEAKALEMSEEKVKDALKKKGYKLKDVGSEKIKQLAKEQLEKYPQIRESAKKIVEQQNQAVGEVEVDVSGVAEPTA